MKTFLIKDNLKYINNEINTFNKNVEEGELLYANNKIELYHRKIDEIVARFIEYCTSGKEELVLLMEPYYYDKLVKKIETEEHVVRCFSKYSQLMWKFGKIASKRPVKQGLAHNICFISKTSVLLGHTEVMLNVLKDWKKTLPNLNLFFVGLSPCKKNLYDRLVGIGINIITPNEEMSPLVSALWIREACEKNNIGTAIWLSVPIWVSFIFGFGVAKKQVLWSLKFHAIHLGDEVLHIGMTKEKDGIAYINGKPWEAYQPKLLTKNESFDFIKRKEIRGNLDNFFIFGTLAREEKYNSLSFVNAIIEILSRCPFGIFLYTGRKNSPFLSKALEDSGLNNRATFIGWVDTNFYSNIIDLFLETFPFGCGVTGIQALANNTVLNSLWDSYTVPRYYFENLKEAVEFHQNWIINETVNQYINSACLQYTKWHNGEQSQKFNIELIKTIESKKSERLFEIINRGHS